MELATQSSPRLKFLAIEGVRLYNDGQRLEIELSHPIEAFVGANGVGKSTLLSLIDFGLTGLVPDPEAIFQSVDEFPERTAPFASRYFEGRVNEEDRDTACVTIRFDLGPQTFEVTRGLFDGRGIRSFATIDPSGESEASNPSVRTRDYEDAVVQASGLANFDQFCFWQLFVMTFDERRHLLFWDARTLRAALMIALGRSPQDASTAEIHLRNIERLDSLARNSRWRATQATAKRRKLLESVSGGPSEYSDSELLDLRAEHDTLVARSASAASMFAIKDTELRDSSRTLAELAIAESELQQAYLDAFSTEGPGRQPVDHPAIVGIARSGVCDFCGSRHRHLSQAVQAHLDAQICPLCEARTIDEARDSGEIDRLLVVDESLAAVRHELENARSRYQRLREESDSAADLARNASDDLSEFLARDGAALPSTLPDVDSAKVAQLDAEVADALSDTQRYRHERDALRVELEPIMVALAEAYRDIETKFVPTFRRLAGQFIGRTVDVEFERRGVDVALRFALDGQSRRSASELSESQQYFLDIALRMALIQTFLQATSTLLVDTPEGSLDIAYETRAGQLFDQFASEAHSILLTSNLNASNLMLELARASGPDGMKIFKMTDWVQLSDIQLESGPLFDQAYANLNSALLEHEAK